MADKEFRFPYKWKKEDLKKVDKHGHKVFSTFACGGGSSFGYKMAGFDVIGCNEIDPEMIKLYKKNHNPKYDYLEPIQEFKNRDDLPEELFDLDILDGSPPCSTFSMSGSREKVWGKEKKFREGQAKQVLSDLFFDYLDVVEKLRPKICVAENVKGMIIGKAKGYCKLIRDRFDELGYDAQMFLLMGASMGVPQARERVFFIARRKDLALPPLRMSFGERPITFREMTENLPFQDLADTEPCDTHRAFWHRTRPGNNYSDVAQDRYFNFMRLAWDKPSPTILGSSADKYGHPEELRLLSWIEVSLIGSYPYDYDFMGKKNRLKVYCIGMSVPPVMTAPAEQIDKGWS
jgi:DNA (cytosine-5)-methyltransferase 1